MEYEVLPGIKVQLPDLRNPAMHGLNQAPAEEVAVDLGEHGLVKLFQGVKEVGKLGFNALMDNPVGGGAETAAKMGTGFAAAVPATVQGATWAAMAPEGERADAYSAGFGEAAEKYTYAPKTATGKGYDKAIEDAYVKNIQEGWGDEYLGGLVDSGQITPEQAAMYRTSADALMLGIGMKGAGYIKAAGGKAGARAANKARAAETEAAARAKYGEAYEANAGMDTPRTLAIGPGESMRGGPKAPAPVRPQAPVENNLVPRQASDLAIAKTQRGGQMMVPPRSAPVSQAAEVEPVASGQLTPLKADMADQYVMHVDVRGRATGKALENAESIAKEGFRSGYRNTLPISRGGNLTAPEKQYAPRPGDVVYLIPHDKVKNGKIVSGYKPNENEILHIGPGEDVFDAFTRSQNSAPKVGRQSDDSYVSPRVKEFYPESMNADPVFEAEMRRQGQAIANTMAQKPGAQPKATPRNHLASVGPGKYQRGAIGWHGSTHGRLEAVPEGKTTNNIEDLFSLKNVGTGTGAQVEGFGLYFAPSAGEVRSFRVMAENGWEPAQRKAITERFAKDYPDALTDEGVTVADLMKGDEHQVRRIIDDYTANPGRNKALQADRNGFRKWYDKQGGAGHEFEVDVPDPVIARMIDADQPLANQPESVKVGLRQLFDQYDGTDFDAYAARGNDWKDARNNLLEELDESEKSQMLLEVGIPGVRYFGDSARGAAKVGEQIGSREKDLLNKMIEAEKAGKPDLVKKLQKKLDGLEAESFAKPNLVLFDPQVIASVKRDGKSVYTRDTDLETTLNVPDGFSQDTKSLVKSIERRRDLETNDPVDLMSDLEDRMYDLENPEVGKPSKQDLKEAEWLLENVYRDLERISDQRIDDLKPARDAYRAQKEEQIFGTRGGQPIYESEVERAPKYRGDPNQAVYEGNAYRAPGFEDGAPPGATAADVVLEEMERKGIATLDEFGIDDATFEALKNEPADSLMWVGRSKNALMDSYGPTEHYAGLIDDPKNISNVTDTVSGKKILYEDPDGALVHVGPKPGSRNSLAIGPGTKQRGGPKFTPKQQAAPTIIGDYKTTTSGRIRNKTMKDGGYTVDLNTGDVPDTGIMVGKFPNENSRTVVLEGKVTKQDLVDFARSNEKELKKVATYLGTWKNDDKIYLDIARRFESNQLRKSTKYGESTGQDAVYDLLMQQEHPVGNWKEFINSGEFTERMLEMEVIGRKYLKEHGGEWWDIHKTLFETVYGEKNLNVVAGYIASTAPMSDPTSNVQVFSEYMRRHIVGEPIIQPDWRVPANAMKRQPGSQVGNEASRKNNLMRSSRGELNKLQRDKVNQEAKALMGDPEAQVLDRWWSRIGEKPSEGIYTSGKEGNMDGDSVFEKDNYPFMAAAVRPVAVMLKETPRNFTANVWTGMRETVRWTGELFGVKYGKRPQGESKGYKDIFEDLIEAKAEHLGMSKGDFMKELGKGKAELLSLLIATPFGALLLEQLLSLADESENENNLAAPQSGAARRSGT